MLGAAPLQEIVQRALDHATGLCVTQASLWFKTPSAVFFRYCALPRIDAGCPGSFSFLPVSEIFAPSTLRMETSRSV